METTGKLTLGDRLRDYAKGKYHDPREVVLMVNDPNSPLSQVLTEAAKKGECSCWFHYRTRSCLSESYDPAFVNKCLESTDRDRVANIRCEAVRCDRMGHLWTNPSGPCRNLEYRVSYLFSWYQ